MAKTAFIPLHYRPHPMPPRAIGAQKSKWEAKPFTTHSKLKPLYPFALKSCSNQKKRTYHLQTEPLKLASTAPISLATQLQTYAPMSTWPFAAIHPHFQHSRTLYLPIKPAPLPLSALRYSTKIWMTMAAPTSLGPFHLLPKPLRHSSPHSPHAYWKKVGVPTPPYDPYLLTPFPFMWASKNQISTMALPPQAPLLTYRLLPSPLKAH